MTEIGKRIMDRIAILCFFIILKPIFAIESNEQSRLQKELNFILKKENKAPPTQQVFTYEQWQGERNSDLITDSTSTSLAAPIRDKKKENKTIIVPLDENSITEDQGKQFHPTRKRSR